MMKSILLSLTFFGGIFPFLPPCFNLSFTPESQPILEESHIHSMTCDHHSATNIAFGEELGKVIKESDNAYRIKTVVLDPGHGGKDPGCSGATSREKHLALAIAKELSMQLQTAYPDVRVIMTRDRDEFIPLNTRAEIANSNTADLFISIHCNYIRRYTGTKGTETYVLGLHRAEDNLNVAKRENAAILYEEDYQKTYDGFDPDSDEGHIILSMYQSAFLEQSILFGSLVEDKFAKAAHRKSRGVKQAGFLVLRETTMPSVLVEAGFLSNRAEEAYLKSRSGQIQIANSIFEAFRIYKNTVEGVESPMAMTASLKPAVKKQKPVLETPQANMPTSKPAANINLPTHVEYTPTEVQIAATTPIEEKPINLAALEFDEELGETNDEIEILEVMESLELMASINNTEYQSIETPVARDLPVSPKREKEEILVNQKPQMPKTKPREEKAMPLTVAAKEEEALKMLSIPIPEERFIREKSPIQYRVQIAASKNKLNYQEERWRNIPHIVEIVWEKEMHKYQIRNLESFEHADHVRIQMLHKGFIGAFIVAYKDGRRLTSKEMHELR